MAVSKAWTIKTGIKDSLNYVKNKDKTSIMRYIKNESKTVFGDKILVTGHLCNPQTAELEFKMREEAYHAVKKENIAKGIKPNQAIHIIQSFSSKDSANMTPEELHDYGLEFAGMICGEHFQAVVASHLNNPDQLHNHIVVNAYALDGIYKFIEDRKCVQRIRELNDELCQKYDLEIIIPERMDKVANYKEWQEKQNGTSWKEAVREDIKAAMNVTNNWYDFKTYLENAGYQITENKKSVSYRAPGCIYTVSDKKLGTFYERASLLEYWEEREKNPELEYTSPITPIEPIKPTTKTEDIKVSEYDNKGNKRGPIEILLLKTLKKLKFLKKNNLETTSQIDNAIYGRVDWKIQNMLDTLALTKENNIQTQEDLSEKINEIGIERNNLRIKLDGDNIEIQNMERTLQEINDFLELEEIVDNMEVDSNLLNVEMPDRETILEARAEQDPMSKRQKMELFKLMETETEYKLDVKFNQITRTEAVEVIAFLKDKTLEQPQNVITVEEFERKREAAQLNAIDNKKQRNIEAKLDKVPMSPKERIAIDRLLKKNPHYQLKYEVKNRKDAVQILNFFNEGGKYPDAFVSEKDIELDKLSIDDRATVKSYLDLKERLYSLGLTDMEKITEYKSELKEKVNTFAEQKEEFKTLGKEYAKFKRMEYNVELAKNPAYTQSREQNKEETQKHNVEKEIETDAAIDVEVENIQKENRHDYRSEDRHFHYDDEER